MDFNSLTNVIDVHKTYQLSDSIYKTNSLTYIAIWLCDQKRKKYGQNKTIEKILKG